MRLNFVPEPLDSLRARKKADVDAAAEACRLQFVTGGAGQAMTYQAKYAEALAYLADPAIADADVPHIAAEVGITAADKAGVASVIVATREAWKQLSAAIDATRLAAKRAINAAETPSAVLAAAQVTWPAP